MPIRVSSNPISFKYIARITLKNPYANVLTILAHRSNLPSIDIHSNKLLFFYLHNIDFYLTIIYHYINRKNKKLEVQ